MNEEIKNAENNDLESMVFRKELTYNEIETVIDVKHVAKTSIGYTLPPGLYEISDIKWMLKSLLPHEFK